MSSRDSEGLPEPSWVKREARLAARKAASKALKRTRSKDGAQLAVMAAPYHPRMNRAYVNEQGEAVTAKKREAFKVEFDQKVFGTQYF